VPTVLAEMRCAGDVDASRLDGFLPLLDPTAVPRVLGRADAVARGYSRGEIEYYLVSGRWRRVLPRTYLTSDTLTWDDRLRAALSFAGRSAVVTGAAALCDSGLRCVSRPDSVLVLVPRTTTARSQQWVRIRRTDRLPAPALLPGPSRAPAARAVADLALEQRRLDDVRTLVAESVRRDLCTVEELAAELDAGPRRGSGHLRAAVTEVASGAWSAPEARAATLLKRGGVPLFEQNVRIDLRNGRYVIVDFLWRALRAVLEIDSDTHHAHTADAEGTANKHLALETLGFSVVHRTPAFVMREPRAFVQGIAGWLEARRRQLNLIEPH
jgi:very-short-patch-repair endonuclease